MIEQRDRTKTNSIVTEGNAYILVLLSYPKVACKIWYFFSELQSHLGKNSFAIPKKEINKLKS